MNKAETKKKVIALGKAVLQHRIGISHTKVLVKSYKHNSLYFTEP